MEEENVEVNEQDIHSQLCRQVMDIKAQIASEAQIIAELTRSNVKKDKEVEVLRREEKALGLLKLRQNRDKLQAELDMHNARLQDEDVKLAKTLRGLSSIDTEMADLRNKIQEQSLEVERLRARKKDADKELSVLRTEFNAEFAEQRTRRSNIEAQ